MNPIIANIRGTFFTNKPLEVDYNKSMRIVAGLQSYQLFTFPVNGLSFQISPSGMIPVTLNSYEFRNSDNSLNITIGPDRVDVNQCKKYDDIGQAYMEGASHCQQVISAFHSIVEFKETRLALASTWVIAMDNLDVLSRRFLSSEQNENLIEWENKRVERRLLESIGVLINYGHKIARSQIKLPVEQVLADRIFIETDINTVPLPPDILDIDKTSRFFEDAIENSKKITSDYYKKITL